MEKEKLHDKERWNKIAPDFQRTMKAFPEDKYSDELMDFLGERGAVYPGGRVADIGCGAGKYALRFASAGCPLLLIDISDKMLEYTRQNLEGTAGEREFVECDFAQEDMAQRGWEKSVDLAFASMSPAAMAPGGVEKMSQMSRKSCFLSTYSKMQNRLFDTVCGLMGLGELENAHDFPYVELEERVKALGYTPETRLVEHGWVNELPPEALEQKFFTGQISRFEDTPENHAGVLSALKTLQNEAGLVRETVDAWAAWIYWQV